MKSKRKNIAEMLQFELSSVYCDTCNEGLQTDVCEDCSRKEMMWGISEDYADYLAGKVLRLDKNNKE